VYSGLQIRLNFRFGSNKNNAQREEENSPLPSFNFFKMDQQQIQTMSNSAPYVSQWGLMQMMAQQRGIPVRNPSVSILRSRPDLTFRRVFIVCAKRGFLPSLSDFLSIVIEDDSLVEEAEMLTCVV
jgi:hypothetical protein